MKNKEILTLTTFACVLLSLPSFGEMICKTPRESKIIVISQSNIKIEQQSLFNTERSVASVDAVRTKLTGPGFTKVLFSSGYKHTIHVENAESPSNLDDYLIIRSTQGHEITYPIECEGSL